MGNTAIISLEEFRQARVRAEMRHQLHEYLDHWLDAVEERLPEKTLTLDQMTQAVFAMRHELTGMITEALVEQRHRQTLQQQRLPCPHCGRLLRARWSHARTVETMVGAVSLRRPYFYCLRLSERILSARRSPSAFGAPQAMGHAESSGQSCC